VARRAICRRRFEENTCWKEEERKQTSDDKYKKESGVRQLLVESPSSEGLLLYAAQILSRWPGKVASAEQVKVEMEDGLTAAWADVVDRAIAVLDVAFAR
jgi:hypothetical protein